jgi:hypothetical protein
VLADEELMDDLEEEPRFGTLDDPVVVGGGERHDLADPER